MEPPNGSAARAVVRGDISSTAGIWPEVCGWGKSRRQAGTAGHTAESRCPSSICVLRAVFDWTQLRKTKEAGKRHLLLDMTILPATP
jgi:hypothetical protein